MEMSHNVCILEVLAFTCTSVYHNLRFHLKKWYFLTAMVTNDDVATATCISGFCGHFYFIFLSTIQNKWKLMHANFPEQWMKIVRDITQLHKLSEQPKIF